MFLIRFQVSIDKLVSQYTQSHPRGESPMSKLAIKSSSWAKKSLDIYRGSIARGW
ncbi:hypothetical protein VAA_00343 [Vibrio anguillarum 775]|nr:hypothetical protein VAA_00343 [Vibrio anguillarum 775]ARV27066.1 hypothetical protein A6A12_0016 [Vibrio anguillarum]